MYDSEIYSQINLISIDESQFKKLGINKESQFNTDCSTDKSFYKDNQKHLDIRVVSGVHFANSCFISNISKDFSGFEIRKNLDLRKILYRSDQHLS